MKNNATETKGGLEHKAELRKHACMLERELELTKYRLRSIENGYGDPGADATIYKDPEPGPDELVVTEDK